METDEDRRVRIPIRESEDALPFIENYQIAVPFSWRLFQYDPEMERFSPIQHWERVAASDLSWLHETLPQIDTVGVRL